MAVFGTGGVGGMVRRAFGGGPPRAVSVQTATHITDGFVADARRAVGDAFEGLTQPLVPRDRVQAAIDNAMTTFQALAGARVEGLPLSGHAAPGVGLPWVPLPAAISKLNGCRWVPTGGGAAGGSLSSGQLFGQIKERVDGMVVGMFQQMLGNSFLGTEVGSARASPPVSGGALNQGQVRRLQDDLVGVLGAEATLIASGGPLRALGQGGDGAFGANADRLFPIDGR